MTYEELSQLRPGDRIRCCDDSIVFRNDVFKVIAVNPTARSVTASVVLFERETTIEWAERIWTQCERIES